MPLKRALILDTNVILRFLLKDISELYQRAEQVFQLVENDKLEVLLSDLVLSECIWVLEKFYKVPRQQISQNLLVFLQAKGVITETPKLVLEKGLSTWSKSSLDWTDALLVAKSTHGNTKLITFDQEIRKKFPGLVFPI